MLYVSLSNQSSGVTLITIRGNNPWDNSWLSCWCFAWWRPDLCLACSRDWVVSLGHLGGVLITDLAAELPQAEPTTSPQRTRWSRRIPEKSFSVPAQAVKVPTLFVVWYWGYLGLFSSDFPKDIIPVMKTKVCVNPGIQFMHFYKSGNRKQFHGSC